MGSDQRTGTVSADPGRLREYTALTRATVAPVRQTLGVYRALVEQHAVAANDLGAPLWHGAPEVEALLEALDRLDRLPAALAFALEELDAAPLWSMPAAWVAAGWPVATGHTALLDALVQARLAYPAASAADLRRLVLDAAHPTPAGAAAALRSLLDDVGPAGALFELDPPADIAVMDAGGLRWDRLATWLAGPRLDVLERARRVEPHFEELLAHVAMRGDDPEWLASFFGSLGPVGTLRTTELLGVVGWADALDGEARHITSAVHRTRVERWSVALGQASQARSATGGWALGDAWFATLLGRRTASGDVPDTLGLVFAAGTFRDDIAARAAALGVAVLAGNAHVDRRWGQSALAGFDQLVIDPGAEAALLLAPAARSPRAAAAVVTRGVALDGRPAAEVLTDHSLRGDAATAAVAVVRSATLAMVDADDATDVAASWQATAAVLGAVAGRRGSEVVHGSEMAGLLADLALLAQRHALVRSRSGTGDIRVVGPPVTGAPDALHAIEIPSQVLAEYLAVVARDDTARTRLLVETDLGMRAAYLDAVATGASPDELRRLVSRMATVRGALLRAQLVAANDDTARVVGERQATNRAVEQLWRVLSAAVGATPAGRMAEVTQTALWGIGVAGVDDAVLGRLDYDVEALVAETRAANRATLFDSAMDSQVFVVSLVYTDLQRRLAAEPALPLDPLTAALHDDLAEVAPWLDPAHDHLDDIDPDEWAAVADHVTRGDNGVAALWAEVDRRMDDLYPEVDLDPAATIGGS